MILLNGIFGTLLGYQHICMHCAQDHLFAVNKNQRLTIDYFVENLLKNI
jgi:hypothetical protein